jgi:hypothetical protein
MTHLIILQEVQSNEQVRVDNSDYNTKFLIFRATRALSGVYTITATNSQGEDKAEVEILILGKTFVRSKLLIFHQ